MKSKKGLVLLLLLLAGLVLSYIKVSNLSNDKQDLYKLNSWVYLQKVDYFSKYNILSRENGNFNLLTSNVVELYLNKEYCLVKYKINSNINFLFLPNAKSETIIANEIEELSYLIEIEDILWKKPMDIVEIKTLSNTTKLIKQILFIAIVVLGFYLIMKIFNLKRLIKSP